MSSGDVPDRTGCGVHDHRPEGELMDPREIANQYYDAWINHRGDMSRVPLADDMVFVGPVASFDSADGYRPMARQAGAAVTSFGVRVEAAAGGRAPAGGAGVGRYTGLVFTRPDGPGWHPQQVTKRFQQLGEGGGAAGVPAA